MDGGVSHVPKSRSIHCRSALHRFVDLERPAGFNKLERGLKQWEMLFVSGHVGAIDLDPFPGACHATGRERHDVISGELQFGRGGSRQAQADALATDAGEHLVADEIGIQAVYFSRTGAREFEKQGVDLRLAGGLGIGSQRVSAGVGMKGAITYYRGFKFPWMPYFALKNEPLRLKNARLCDVVPNTSRLCDGPTRVWGLGWDSLFSVARQNPVGRIGLTMF